MRLLSAFVYTSAVAACALFIGCSGNFDASESAIDDGAFDATSAPIDATAPENGRNGRTQRWVNAACARVSANEFKRFSDVALLKKYRQERQATRKRNPNTEPRVAESQPDATCESADALEGDAPLAQYHPHATFFLSGNSSRGIRGPLLLRVALFFLLGRCCEASLDRNFIWACANVRVHGTSSNGVNTPVYGLPSDNTCPRERLPLKAKLFRSKCPSKLGIAPGSAECMTLVVPQNRAFPNQKTVEVPVVIFHPPSTTDALPLVYNVGGPGGSIAMGATKLGPGLARTLARPIVFMEPRGAFLSEPALHCHEGSLSECLEGPINAGVDIIAFNTLEVAADIAELPQLLDVSKVDAWGVSYGTVATLRALERHPESVRVAIIEGFADNKCEPFARRGNYDSHAVDRFIDWFSQKWDETGREPIGITSAEIGRPFDAPRQRLQYAEHAADAALILHRRAANVSGVAESDLVAQWKLEDKIIENMMTYGLRAVTHCLDGPLTWENDPRMTATNRTDKAVKQCRREIQDCVELRAFGATYPPDEFRPRVVHAPVLLLRGGLDRQTPSEWAMEAVRTGRLPNAQDCYAECLGHHFFRPDEPFDGPPAFGLIEIARSFLDAPTEPVPTDSIRRACAAPLPEPRLPL